MSDLTMILLTICFTLCGVILLYFIQDLYNTEKNARSNFLRNICRIDTEIEELQTMIANFEDSYYTKKGWDKIADNILARLQNSFRTELDRHRDVDIDLLNRVSKLEKTWTIEK